MTKRLRILFRPYLSLVKIWILLAILTWVSCTQNTPTPTEKPVEINKEKAFFEEVPVLTPIAFDEAQLFAPLFAQLSDLPSLQHKNLGVQLQAIGQEADKIQPDDFPEALQIPQLIGRYKVFRTRIGIVRHADASQYDDLRFATAMNDVVEAWNIFARHYNRLATQSNL